MPITITLNNGVEMPALGLGVFQTPPEETRDAVRSALDAGYRLIDTAAAYGNERQVGEAVHRSDVARSEIFLETKIWISDYGYDQTLHAFAKSARKLGVEQIDLLILHQALPSAFDRTVESYRALETLLADGKVRAIGVSNFMVEHLTTLLEHATVRPAVNQIECHPYFAQPDVQDFDAEHGILTQAWSPIGGITFYRDGSHGSTLDDPVIADTASAHAKTPAQVMLRWGLQHGRSVIPKSTKRSRITENINLFDFELSTDEMAGDRRPGHRPSRRPRARHDHAGGVRPRNPGSLRAPRRAQRPGLAVKSTGAPTIASGDALITTGHTQPRHRLAPEVPPLSPHRVPSLDSCSGARPSKAELSDQVPLPARVTRLSCAVYVAPDGLASRAEWLSSTSGTVPSCLRQHRPKSHSMSDRVSERRRAAQLARHYRDQENLTIAEIARRLGRAEATIKAYLYDPS